MYTIIDVDVVDWFAENTNAKIRLKGENKPRYAFVGIDGKACVPFVDYSGVYADYVRVYTKDEYKIVN